PIDIAIERDASRYFLSMYIRSAAAAKNNITMSLWDETRDSIMSKGLSAKSERTNKGFFLLVNLAICSITYAVPINALVARILKRKKVGRKYPIPVYERGTVATSHVGP